MRLARAAGIRAADARLVDSDGLPVERTRGDGGVVDVRRCLFPNQ